MNRKLTVRDLIFWFAIIAVIILLARTCTPKFGGLFGSKTDTIRVVRDTVITINTTDTQYIPQVTTLTNTIYKPYYKTDTLETLEVRIEPADTAAIVARFNERAFYSDKQLVNGGSITIEDSLYQNRITNRRLITNIPTTTITNTITLKENRNVVYAGLGAIGNEKNLSVGGDLSLKTRNDNMYSVGAFITKTGDLQYQFMYKVPIRLKKRK